MWMPTEALAWSWNYRPLWVTWYCCWELNSGPLVRALSNWAISPTPGICLWLSCCMHCSKHRDDHLWNNLVSHLPILMGKNAYITYAKASVPTQESLQVALCKVLGFRWSDEGVERELMGLTEEGQQLPTVSSWVGTEKRPSEPGEGQTPKKQIC